MFLEIVVELSVGDARFNKGVAEIAIDFEDAIHAMQIENDLSPLGQSRGAVA